ncbi:MAG: multifunctional CCA tRNA nucleotidyl transferase/2'3'-cyclic phosphodiesterase/2'nucleotidase/phosphatase [Betaproteobacteria bacterium]|nr:multifunctional CCA tRNA nucleotidyl transferase/2'3'-cyclic phosphodiesterase/2'nucleotidase/phosphatase [Betaproteobacteria bacterium]MSQ88823.1 multifunctional CCA tRNA nucleotidyl transferase/2'3'-cyclic phosphodiesterase/2'nucleotidase/phosphatase [Betaproteobacteria bacterium]
MKVYVVGGAVRDELLGLAVQDRDYVVVGTTPEEMVAAGYKPVGKDFPVFLHPETHEEYALARTERKSGRGYKGFTVYSAPDVTLEQDLARRDLTINAMAKAPDGACIDPYGGERDLRDGVLRHVSEAFAEDPVRILRISRFAARFGFRIADETMALMTAMAASGETDHLVPERAWQEFAKGLLELHPALMFEALERCGLRAKLLPEIQQLPGVFSGSLAVRFTVLCWPLQEAQVKALCDRLKVPNQERELALLACRCQSLLRAARPDEFLKLFKRADAFRRPERFALLLRSAKNTEPGFNPENLDKALAAATAVDAGEIARRAVAPAAIPALLEQAREQAIAAALA